MDRWKEERLKVYLRMLISSSLIRLLDRRESDMKYKLLKLKDIRSDAIFQGGEWKAGLGMLQFITIVDRCR